MKTYVYYCDGYLHDAYGDNYGCDFHSYEEAIEYCKENNLECLYNEDEI